MASKFKDEYTFTEASGTKAEIVITANQPQLMDKDHLNISRIGSYIEFRACVDRCGEVFVIPKKELLRLMERL